MNTSLLRRSVYSMLRKNTSVNSVRCFATGLDLSITTPSSQMLTHMVEVAAFDKGLQTNNLASASSNLARALDIVQHIPDVHVQLEVYLREYKLYQIQGKFTEAIATLDKAFRMFLQQYPVNSKTYNTVVGISLTKDKTSSTLLSLYHSFATTLYLLHVSNSQIHQAKAVLETTKKMYEDLRMDTAESSRAYMCDLAILESILQMSYFKEYVPDMRLGQFDVVQTHTTGVDGSGAGNGTSTPKVRERVTLKLTSVRPSANTDTNTNTNTNTNTSTSSTDIVQDKMKQQIADLDKEEGASQRTESKDTESKGSVELQAWNTFVTSPDLSNAGYEYLISILTQAFDKKPRSYLINALQGLVQTMPEAQTYPHTYLTVLTQFHSIVKSLTYGIPSLTPYLAALEKQVFTYMKTHTFVNTNEEEYAVVSTPFAEKYILGAAYTCETDSIPNLTTLLKTVEKQQDAVLLAQTLWKLGSAYLHLNPVNAEGLFRTAKSKFETSVASHYGKQLQYDFLIDYAHLVSMLAWNGKVRMGEAVQIVSQTKSKYPKFASTLYNTHITNNYGKQADWETTKEAWEDYTVTFHRITPTVQPWHFEQYGI